MFCWFGCNPYCPYHNFQNLNLLHNKANIYIGIKKINVLILSVQYHKKLTEQKQHCTLARGILHKDQAQQDPVLMRWYSLQNLQFPHSLKDQTNKQYMVIETIYKCIQNHQKILFILPSPCRCSRLCATASWTLEICCKLGYQEELIRTAKIFLYSTYSSYLLLKAALRRLSRKYLTAWEVIRYIPNTVKPNDMYLYHLKNTKLWQMLSFFLLDPMWFIKHMNIQQNSTNLDHLPRLAISSSMLFGET